MKANPLFSFVFLLTFLFTAGPVHAVDMTQAGKMTVLNNTGRYQRMADNFFIIYDPSDSMAVPYKQTGLTRLEAEKQILLKSNATLPDLGWQTGLYPHWKGGLWLHGSYMAFRPYYELKRYDKKDFAQAIEKLPVKPTGPPMLQRGLMKLEHLLGLPGRTEVFIFSDGQHSTAAFMEPDPLTEAKKLSADFDVCFTIISSASTNKEKRLLHDIASVNTCSQVIDFDTVYDKPEHLFGKLYMDTDREVFNNVLFDFDKYAIKTESKPTLDKLGKFLQDRPEAYVVLSGFCDAKGTDAYNMKLSKKRVDSVSSYLSKRYDISQDRILTYWYGSADPVATNETKEGRALNRRVTMVIRFGK